MKNVEEVGAYKTTDNQLHHDLYSAIRHQEKLDLERSVYEFCNKHFSHTDTQEEVADALIENWNEIKEIVLQTTGK